MPFAPICYRVRQCELGLRTSRRVAGNRTETKGNTRPDLYRASILDASSKIAGRSPGSSYPAHPGLCDH